jgi:molybdopterin synthase sulfur carrier subunit
MQVKLVYLARLREALGMSEEQVELPPEIRDVAALAAWLRQRGAAWERELSTGSRLRIAVDHKMAESDTPIRDGTEVAFFPPVTGGWEMAGKRGHLDDYKSTNGRFRRRA